MERATMKLATAILAAVLACVSQPLAAQDVPALDENIAEPAMWRVSDADSEFILLGTFHILPPSLQWRTDALEAAIANADIVYFEVEADAPDAQAKTLNILMTQGFNPPGTTLSSLLDDSDAAALSAISNELGLPYAAIDPMRPWQAFLTLSVQFIVKQGFQPGAGVDSVLLAESRTLGKDVRFFETIEQQLKLFTELDPDTEKSLLVITIRDWDEQREAFDDLYNAWRAGDAEFIDEQMNATMREQAPLVYERLIIERNTAWADEIAAAMESAPGKALVAVGAGHLVGDEHSVPALLKARGFEVSRYGLDEPATEEAANDNQPPPSEDAADDIGDLLEELDETGRP